MTRSFFVAFLVVVAAAPVAASPWHDDPANWERQDGQDIWLEWLFSQEGFNRSAMQDVSAILPPTPGRTSVMVIVHNDASEPVYNVTVVLHSSESDLTTHLEETSASRSPRGHHAHFAYIPAGGSWPVIVNLDVVHPGFSAARLDAVILYTDVNGTNRIGFQSVGVEIEHQVGRDSSGLFLPAVVVGLVGLAGLRRAQRVP